MSNTGSALDPYPFRNGFVARNSFHDRLCHTILAVTHPNLRGNHVILTCFHLACFRAITRELVGIPEHRAARRHAERNSG